MEFKFIWWLIWWWGVKRMVEKILTANDNLKNKDQLVSIIWQAIVEAESDGWLKITNNRECLSSLYGLKGVEMGDSAKDVVG